MANKTYAPVYKSQQIARQHAAFTENGIRDGGRCGIVSNDPRQQSFVVPQSQQVYNYPPIALVTGKKISQMNNSSQVQIRDIVTGQKVTNVNIMYPCLSLNPAHSGAGSKYLVFYGTTDYIANLQQAECQSTVQPKQKGLSKCQYTTPFNSSSSSGGSVKPGTIYASGDRQLYAYYEDLSSVSKYFVWYSDAYGCHLMTKDNPIIAFYIKDTQQLLQFKGYRDGAPMWESSKYTLRYSMYYRGWMLYEGSAVPYIPEKKQQDMDYVWYYSSSLPDKSGSSFMSYGKKDVQNLVLQSTYAMKETSKFSFQVDNTKKVSQPPPSNTISFGYPVAEFSKGQDSQIGNCYYVRVFGQEYTYKFIDIDTKQVVATYKYQKDNSTLFFVNSGQTFVGGAIDIHGNTSFKKEGDQKESIEVSFSGDVQLGTQKTVCYYGEIATWS